MTEGNRRKIPRAVLESFSPLYRQVADQFIASGHWIIDDSDTAGATR